VQALEVNAKTVDLPLLSQAELGFQLNGDKILTEMIQITVATYLFITVKMV